MDMLVVIINLWCINVNGIIKGNNSKPESLVIIILNIALIIIIIN